MQERAKERRIVPVGIEAPRPAWLEERLRHREQAQEAALDANIRAFCWQILANEQQVQVDQGRPPLDQAYVAKWFGPEYAIPYGD